MKKAMDASRNHRRYDPEFKELWSRVLRDVEEFKALKVSTYQELLAAPVDAAPKFKVASTVMASQKPSESVAVTRRCKLPRVGTVIERSTISNRRKFWRLLLPLPPLPHRYRKARVRVNTRAISSKQVRLIQLFGDTLSDMSDDEATAKPIPKKRKQSAKSPSTGQPPSTSAIPLPSVIAPLPPTVETPSPQTIKVTLSSTIVVPPTPTSNTTPLPATRVTSSISVHLNDVFKNLRPPRTQPPSATSAHQSRRRRRRLSDSTTTASY